MEERCKILCKNNKCMFWAGTKKEYFKPTKNYVNFEDDYYTGICTKSTLRLVPVYHESKNYLFKFVSCKEGTVVSYTTNPCIECQDIACLWNFAGYCGRENGIAIDAVPYGAADEMEISCRGRSDKKIKGHLDFSRFICKEGSKLPDPPGYADNFWEKKREKIKELKKAGVSEEYLNQVYGYEIHK